VLLADAVDPLEAEAATAELGYWLIVLCWIEAVDHFLWLYNTSCES
jgi:hypothetical protein